MRLWSLHPSYLDSAGLVALWRESLLARKVLEGQTKGYRHHPQLERFKNSKTPLGALEYYLSVIYRESQQRGYAFDLEKLRNSSEFSGLIPVTQGQLNYEWNHLLKKLQIRNFSQYEKIIHISPVTPHPLFHVIAGDISPWEIRL